MICRTEFMSRKLLRTWTGIFLRNRHIGLINTWTKSDLPWSVVQQNSTNGRDSEIERLGARHTIVSSYDYKICSPGHLRNIREILATNGWEETANDIQMKCASPASKTSHPDKISENRVIQEHAWIFLRLRTRNSKAFPPSPYYRILEQISAYGNPR